MSISLEDFREKMKSEAEKTSSVKKIRVSGRTLDDALKQASMELSLPIRILDYEIIDRGRLGIMGINSSPCRIVAYQAAKTIINEEKEDEFDDAGFNLDGMDLDIPEDYSEVENKFTVRLDLDGAKLKVFPPRANSEPVTVKEVMTLLHERHVRDVDEDLVKKAIEHANGIWLKVGNFTYRPVNDAVFKVEISNDDMKAYITAQKPGKGGRDVSAQIIRDTLPLHGINHGVLEDKLKEFEEHPIYEMPYCVAKGSIPRDGEDAKIIYHFDTEPNKINLHEEEDGSVNFKELNKFQNVVKGQSLAKKIPSSKGKNGMTVLGSFIRAKEGKDVNFNLGHNVELIDDGNIVIASADGHVMLKSGKINVETILIIPGNIDTRTGNIDVLSSVDIRGNVEDGFSVKSEANVTVSGYVGRANLKAGGDIIVARGINGGEENEYGNIQAGNNIWSSFIQNANVESGGYVIVSSGILNSNISAQRKVLCKGRRARIVGGYVRASEEVNAVTLGSSGGAKTVIEVGFDAKAKEELDVLKKQYKELGEKIAPLQLNLRGIMHKFRIKKVEFSAEKKKAFLELKKVVNRLNQDIHQVEEEMEKRQKYLDDLLINGKISSSSKVLSGVVIRIKGVEYLVRESYEHPVTFVLEDDYIKTVMYQEISDEIMDKDIGR